MATRLFFVAAFYFDFIHAFEIRWNNEKSHCQHDFHPIMKTTIRFLVKTFSLFCFSLSPTIALIFLQRCWFPDQLSHIISFNSFMMEVPNHIETSLLIWIENQWTGFYMKRTFVMKELNEMIWLNWQDNGEHILVRRKNHIFISLIIFSLITFLLIIVIRNGK